MSQVLNVFDQFAVQIDGETQLFATKVEAEMALATYTNGAQALELANAYVAAKGLTDKNAKSKINVITDFLAWEATYNYEGAEETAEATPFEPASPVETEEDDDLNF